MNNYMKIIINAFKQWIDRKFTAFDDALENKMDRTEVINQINAAVSAIEIPEQAQADWSQNDPTQPDYVKNRTHWEENNQTVIMYDGNSDGKVTTNFGDTGDVYVKVSDCTPSLNDLKGGTVFVDGESAEITEDTIPALFVEGKNVLQCGEMILVFYNTTYEREGEEFTTPSIGTYVNRDYPNCGFTYGSTTVHQLDPKFLPEGGVGWEENNQTVIEWDGSTEGRDSTVIGEYTFYKVSDETPGKSELVGATMTVNGETAEITDGMLREGDGAIAIIPLIVVAYKTELNLDGASAVLPSTGIYVNHGLGALTLTYGSTTVHQLDEKFIPDSIARKSDIPVVPVTSVNGMTGDVVIDIPEINYPVTSVNGMVGDVVIDIPSVLPNPNALTFTGVVSGTYDGSSAVSIEIPSGLPEVAAENEGAFLRIVNGIPTWVVLEVAEEGVY